MIKVRFVQFLPDARRDDTQWRWIEEEFLYTHGRTFGEYFPDLEPKDIAHIVWMGKPIYGEAIFHIVPLDGDEIHVVPNIDGKNSSTIMGVLGAVVAIALAYPTGGASLAWWMGSGLSAAAMGYALGSYIGSLMAPKPRTSKQGDGDLTSYTWGGVTNAYREGGSIPILLGRRRIAGTRVGSFVRVSGTQEVWHSLYLLGKGPFRAVEKVGPDPYSIDPDVPYNVEINGELYTNFKDVSVEVRLGTTGQSVIRGFEASVITYEPNMEITAAGVVYTPPNDDEADELEIVVTAPMLGRFNKEGVLKENTTKFDVFYREVGTVPWTKVDGEDPSGAHVMTGQSRSTQYKVIRVPDLPLKRYEIKLTFVSAEYSSDPDRHFYKVFLRFLNLETQNALTYDGYAMLAVRALATDHLSNNVPTVTALCRGWPVRTWNGGSFLDDQWDGADTLTPPGRNPGWLVPHLMRESDVGMGKRIASDDKIIWSAWKEFADYCATIVPREDINGSIDELQSTATSIRFAAPQNYPTVGGRWAIRVTHVEGDPSPRSEFRECTPVTSGGMLIGVTFATPLEVALIAGDTWGFGPAEARCQLDIYLDQESQALDVITELLGGQRATPVLLGDKWSIVVDKPSPISQIFNVGNMVKGSFNTVYKRDKHFNAYESTIANELIDYENDTIVTPVPGVTVVDGGPQPVKAQGLSMPGVVRKGQAQRQQRYRLLGNWYLGRIATFLAFTDSVLAQVGDVIGVQHNRPQWGYGGRVMPGSEEIATPVGPQHIVMLDREVTIEPGVTYALRVVHQGDDPAGEVRIVADGPGTYFGLNVAEAFSVLPEEGDIWTFGPANRDVKPFRILSIGRSSTMIRQITAVEYNESIMDDSGVIEQTNYSLLPNPLAPPPPIVDFTLSTETVRQQDESIVINLIAQWTPPRPQAGKGAYQDARVDLSWNGTNFESITHAVREWRWENVPQGVPIWIRVTPRSISGRYNENGAATRNLTTPGYSNAPAAVPNFRAAVRDNQYVFEWDEVSKSVEYVIARSAAAPWSFDRSMFGTVSAFTAPTAIASGLITIDGVTRELQSGATGPTITVGSAIGFHFVEGDFVDAYVGTARAIKRWTTGANDPFTGIVWKGRSLQYSFIPTAALGGRPQTLYIKAVDAFGNASVGAVQTTLNDTAPAAPTLSSPERYRNSLRLRVTPPAGVTDLVALRLHASQTPGFVPSASTEVAQVVGPNGGEFSFVPPTGVPNTTTWYFKATAEDWLSQRLGDWIYSSQQSGQLVFITPTAPTDVTMTKTNRAGRRGFRRFDDPSGDYEPFPTYELRVAWKWTQSGNNPPNSHLGFQVVIYDADNPDPLGAIAESEITSGITWIEKVGTDGYSLTFNDFIIDDQTPANGHAAVRAVFAEGIMSPWVNDLGQSFAYEPDPPLSETIDPHITIGLPDDIWDYAPWMRDLNGMKSKLQADDTTPSQNVFFSGDGVVVESIADTPVGQSLISGFGVNNGTVVPSNDSIVQQPIPGENVPVWKVTATAAGTVVVWLTVQIGEAVGGKEFGASAWMWHEFRADENLRLYMDSATNFGRGNSLVDAPPRTWTRMDSKEPSWPAGDAGTFVNIVMSFVASQAGQVFYFAAPTLSRDYFAHWPSELPTPTRAARLTYQPGPIGGSSFTALWRVMLHPHAFPWNGPIPVALFIARAPNNGLAAVFLNVATATLSVQIRNATFDNVQTYSIPAPADLDTWHTVGLRRTASMTWDLFWDGAKVITINATANPTAAGAFTFMAYGSTETSALAIEGTMRNLSLWAKSLNETTILQYSRQGLRFVPITIVTPPTPHNVVAVEVEI